MCVVEDEKQVENQENSGIIYKYKRNINPNLLKKLKRSGVRYNSKDLLAIAKNNDGKIIWLEKGNEFAGLKHILQHAEQFKQKGIPKYKIGDFIICALKNGKVVGKQRTRTIYEVTFEGKLHRVAISVGDNGFIVGANPKSIK